MEQTRALNALEPFLALSKSANSPRAAADLVTQATSAPNTFVFAELLQTPNVQALRQAPEQSKYLTLLEIFAWGTWADYQSTPNLPSLSPQQQQKLRLLTLLPLAASHKTLTYHHLQSALSLPAPRALEDLITTAIYSQLLTATLDPARGRVAVTSVAPLRDLSPGSAPSMQCTLEDWSVRCDTVLQDLESQMADLLQKAAEAAGRKKRAQKAFESAMADVEKTGKRGTGSLEYEDDGEAMDVDHDSQGLFGRMAGVRTRSSKRVVAKRT